MNAQYHNLMEDIVLHHIDSMLAADKGCCCAVCRADVIALPLTHLPPGYVFSEKGRMLAKLGSYESQSRADVVAAMSEAIKLGRQNPRHG